MDLTMVKAQAYLKAGKTRKSEVLDGFCEGVGYSRRRAACSGPAPLGELVPSQPEAPAGERTGSHITKVYDTARTPCTQMPARKDVPEETKKRLLVTRAELDLMSLHYEIFLCQEQLDVTTKRRQPLLTKKRGNHAYMSSESTT